MFPSKAELAKHFVNNKQCMYACSLAPDCETNDPQSRLLPQAQPGPMQDEVPIPAWRYPHPEKLVYGSRQPFSRKIPIGGRYSVRGYHSSPLRSLAPRDSIPNSSNPSKPSARFLSSASSRPVSALRVAKSTRSTVFAPPVSNMTGRSSFAKTGAFASQPSLRDHSQ